MENYDFITTKINALKEKYPSLRARPDDYVFSVLCVKNHFYKNPALVLNEDEFAEIVVDGTRDGGADILLTDPNSEESDMVIGQSKFHRTISAETVLNAMRKMADFYKDVTAGHYEQFNQRTQSRFLTLNSERGDNSKVHFVFYTSATKKKSLDTADIEKKFRALFDDSSAIEVSILFATDIVEEIREAESRQPTVERGKIRIDDPNNYLLYGDDEAVIVNASAFSIKQLYNEHHNSLLSRNLRYHVAVRGRNNVDNAIKATIKDNPASFWFKNNGITIICDDFEIDGHEVKLRNFSIVNGGQTTYLLSKSTSLDAAHDFWLSCKIIRNVGDTEDEKSAFSLGIATAANDQKPITNADLKANKPEQLRFAQAMSTVGVFYQTKRGDSVPQRYRDPYLHTNLLGVGKLCLAAIFQEPCKSRSKPSAVYSPTYYEPIFDGNQVQVAQICKELLYADNYFRATFLNKFDRTNENTPNADTRITFAHNARTICIAFVALAARYHCGNITDEILSKIFAAAQSDSTAEVLYKTVRDLGDMKCLLPIKLRTDAYDAALEKLFEAIINAGVVTYSIERRLDPTLAPSNYLKKDKKYYSILNDHWATLQFEIQKVFADV